MKSTARLGKHKLVSSKDICKREPVELRRRKKLIVRLTQQLRAVEAEADGRTLTIASTRRVKDHETGQITIKTVNRPVGKHYFSDATGNWYFTLRYGNRPINLGDGKDTVYVGEFSQLAAVIEMLIEDVKHGELDSYLNALTPRKRAS